MRTLVLGLDGAAPELMETWAQAGHLPTFRQLMEEGAWGRLTSTVPPLTPPAWVSSVTGVNPGKHNVFDFTRPTQWIFTQSTYRRPLIDSSDRQAKAVWEYLNEAGYTAGVVTFPGSYPPTPIEGYMLSEPWGAENDYLTQPPALLAELERTVPQWFTRTPLHGLPEGDYAALEQKLFRDLRARFDVLRYLLRHHPTDFTFIVFSEIDTAQHHFWRFLDETHPEYDPLQESPFQHTILRCYQQMDALLAQLLDEMGSDLCLAVYSDHGFGPLAYDVLINVWLVENGFMALKEATHTRPPLINRVLLGKIARWMGLRWLTRRIPERVKSRLPSLPGEFEQIDWERTRVYFSSLAGQSLMLNVKGREPFGVVSPDDEYQRIREEVVAGLKTLRHPETAEPLIAEVYRREEVYHGTFIPHAPDLIVQCAPGFQLQHGFERPLVQPACRDAAARSGAHAPEGMALLWGTSVASQVKFRAHITDIAPTLLHAFELSIPDVDGRVLHKAFASPHYVAAHALVTDSSPYSPEQEKKIYERLRRLGYF